MQQPDLAAVQVLRDGKTRHQPQLLQLAARVADEDRALAGIRDGGTELCVFEDAAVVEDRRRFPAHLQPV